MEEGHGKRVTPQLSAKAQPFRLNQLTTAQPSWSSSLTSSNPCDSLLKPLSNVNLEGDPIVSGLNYGVDSLQGESSGQHNNYAVYAYETLLVQGKPIKKSKHFNGNSASSSQNCSRLTMGNETSFPSRSRDQVDAGNFSFSAVNSVVATPNEFPVFSASTLQKYSHPKLPYTAPVASCNQTNSPMTFGESTLTKYVPCTASQSPKDEGNERKYGEVVSSEATDSLPTSKSDSEVTLKKLQGKSSLEYQDAEETITEFDENDSDVDSPCYISLSYRKTPLEFSRSLSSHSIKKLQESGYSLNPCAPHFIPRPSKAIVNCYVKQYDADNFSSSGKAVSGTLGAVNSFSKAAISVDKAGGKSSLLINGMDKTSSNFNGSKREYVLLEKSGSSSALSKGVSKFVSTNSKIDVTAEVLDRMHDLSSFLLETCSSGDLLNGHDLIQLIIDNLCMCIEKSNRGKSPMPDLMVSGTPNFPNKLTKIIELGCSSRGVQARNAEPFDLPHQLGYQNLIDRFGHTERMLDSFPPDSNIGSVKSKHTIQVMGNSVENFSTKDEIDSEALVYKKLWLEAEATVCAMKYERCVMQGIAYGMAQSKHN